MGIREQNQVVALQIKHHLAYKSMKIFEAWLLFANQKMLSMLQINQND